jgi:HEAT repeat protein
MRPVRRNIQKMLESQYVSATDVQAWNAIYDFVETGDAARLRSAPALRSCSSHVFEDVAPAAALDQDTARFVQALLVTGCVRFVVVWYLDQVASERDGVDTHALLRKQLQDAGQSAPDLLERTVDWARLSREDGSPTSAGRWVMSHTDAAILAAASGLHLERGRASVLQLLLSNARDRLPGYVPGMLRSGKVGAVTTLLERDAAGFEPYVVGYLAEEQDADRRQEALRRMHAHYGDRYQRQTSDAVVTWLHGAYPQQIWGLDAVKWLVDHDTGRAVEALAQCNAPFRRPDSVVSYAVERLGSAARPLLVAWLRHWNPHAVLAATRALVALDERPDEELLRGAVGAAASNASADVAVPFVELIAATPKLACCIDVLWECLGHASLPVRRAASRALARRGDASAARALDLLGASAAGTRLAAAGVLMGIGTPQAIEAVDRHLDAERNAATADEILTALVDYRGRRGGAFTRADVARAIARDRARFAEPPRPWVDRSALPPLVDVTGAPLAPDEVAYLLLRQSCCKEMVQDVVARPIYDHVDRTKSGDFAFELLRQFLRSPQEAKDRWALVVACRLGDERVVPLLTRQIHDWAASGRGKLAEWTVEALALQGGDVALLAVDAIAIKYRSANANVGRAAGAALDRAADELGVSRDELGDRIVPWLVFPPGAPKSYDADGRRLELRIGTDFKPRLVDVAKRKELGSMPKSAGAEAVAEFAELKKTLRDVAKNQLLRVESLFIRQRRWSAARWKELFLGHPLLLPFAVGLVWGVYRGAALAGTFRALGDRTLTDAEDEPFDLPLDAEIGIVHPLELDDAGVARWRAHLVEHEVEPPFPQLSRPIVRVSDAERGARVYTALNGTKLNALTFKGRATRLGWRPGSVGDAGSVESYFVEFPGTGTNAYLMLQDMFASIDREWEVTLLDLYFTRGSSGGDRYYYAGEPKNADAPHVLAFGDVPPVVFSEVLAGVAAIAGKGPDGEAEEGEAPAPSGEGAGA